MSISKIYKHTKREREQKELEENYPWLDPSDERKYMTDQEILDKDIGLEKFMSNRERKRKKEVMAMLYEYKEAFSLKDEIGTCPT